MAHVLKYILSSFHPVLNKDAAHRHPTTTLYTPTGTHTVPTARRNPSNTCSQQCASLLPRALPCRILHLPNSPSSGLKAFEPFRQSTHSDPLSPTSPPQTHQSARSCSPSSHSSAVRYSCLDWEYGSVSRRNWSRVGRGIGCKRRRGGEFREWSHSFLTGRRCGWRHMCSHRRVLRWCLIP